uniref:Synaptobrevin, longin-like domain protein n=1 Tax=Tanacetum cinerariifolium TaxID=118510 RepID=A0A6L2J9F1_TANCI|nr:hypothetical protein [Tanacetum cinerariifolium]
MARLEFYDKHNMVAYLEKSECSEEFHQIIDFLSASHIKYALTEKPTIYASIIEQFWQTTALSIIEDDVIAITATIDRKVKVLIIKAFIRRHLKLEYSKGLSTLTTKEIFEQLARIGYVTTSDSLTFQKVHFSPQWKFFIHTILYCLCPKKTAWEQFSSNIATAFICLATNKTFNFSKLIFDAMVKNLDNPYKFLMYPRFIQIFLNKHQRLIFPHTRTYPTPTLTHKLFSNMKRASKGYTGVITPLFDTMLVQHQDEDPSIYPTPVSSPSIITSSPSLSPQHTSINAPSTSQPPNIQTTPVAEEPALMPHESPLQSTNKVYSSALTKLILRVKKLERTVKTSKARRKPRIVILEDEDKDDPSKEGRSLIEELDIDVGNSLVPPHAADQKKSDDTQMMFDIESRCQLGKYRVDSVSFTKTVRLTSTASEMVSTAGLKARGKGKAVMQKSEPSKKIKNKIQVQMSMGEELAKKLHEEEQSRFNAEQEEINKARQEKVVAKADQAHDIDWSDPAVIRYHVLQSRPQTVAEVRKSMCIYLKNQRGFKMSHFKGMSYEDIRTIFEKVWDQIHSFLGKWD